MRVNDLAKELGKTNKEILEVLQKNHAEVKSHMSNINDEQISMVKKEMAQGGAKPAEPARQAEAPKRETPKTDTEKSDGVKADGEAPKKKIAAVFRPQNSQQMKNMHTPRPQGSGQSRPAQGGSAPSGSYQGREAGQAQGSQGGYQNNRPQQGGQGSYQNNRPQQGGQGSYQNNRPQQGDQGGYQGNRPQGQGGYQGNRPQGQGGYQGNRPQGQGGFGGGRNFNGQGRDGGRPQGQAGVKRDGGRSFDTPIQAKPQNNRVQNKNYKNDKFDKRDREEDLTAKTGKISKHPFQMPQKVEPKVEETVKSIVIPEILTIKELAEKMKLQPSAIVKKLFLQGKIVTLNQEIDYEQAEEIALEYEVLCEKEKKIDVIEELLKEEEESEEDMVGRPPVVCVMGTLTMARPLFWMRSASPM